MKPRLRILRVITRMNIGGPALHAEILTRRLDATRFDTVLVTGRPSRVEGDWSSRAASEAGRLVRLDLLQRSVHPLKDLVVWWQLVRLIQRWRPQIVHTHMAKAGALGRYAAWVAGYGMPRAERPRIIHTFHGHVLDGYFSPWLAQSFTAIERWLAARTHDLIAVSPSVKADLVARRIAPPERIHVIPLGLPLEPLLAVDGARGLWRTREEQRSFLVVWAGRLVPIKHAKLFIEAVQLARECLPTWGVCGIIAGDGELRPMIERLIAARGLTEHVRCVGWVSDMVSLYADADVVCLTSRNEGTPVAVIEALAAGRPVVATAVGGVPDVLGAGPAQMAALQPGAYVRAVGGLLARSGDAAGVAAALVACAQSPQLCEALGRAGRAFVRERYSATRLLRDMAELYDERTTTSSRTSAAPPEAVSCAS